MSQFHSPIIEETRIPLRFGLYRLTFRALDRVVLPRFPGSAWRGLFRARFEKKPLYDGFGLLQRMRPDRPLSLSLYLRNGAATRYKGHAALQPRPPSLPVQGFPAKTTTRIHTRGVCFGRPAVDWSRQPAGSPSPKRLPGNGSNGAQCLRRTACLLRA